MTEAMPMADAGGNPMPTCSPQVPRGRSVEQIAVRREYPARGHYGSDRHDVNMFWADPGAQ